jgi:dipeptidyl aminopeptidase/acylaminoacyl peptidase
VVVRDSGLAVVDPDGTNARELDVAGLAGHVGAGIVHALAWSPDASRIAIGASSQLPGLRVYVVDAGGGEVRNVGACSGSGGLQWSPDGASIARECWDDGKRHGLAIIDIDTGVERELEGTLSSYGYRGWSWSPDGQSLLFVTYPGPHPRTVDQSWSDPGTPIRTVDVEAGETTELPWVADSGASWQRVP